MVDDRAPGAQSPGEQHGHVYSVANVITMLRLLMIPFFFSALLSKSEGSDGLAFALFAVAAGTDWLDGQIARRTGTVTELGKAIDPLVDRLLIASGVIGLYMVHRLPLWIVLVLVARDLYLLYGAWVLEGHHMRMPVTYIGKVTTAVLLTGFSLLILGWPRVSLGGGTLFLGEILVYIGLALSLTTAALYTVKAKRMLDAEEARR